MYNHQSQQFNFESLVIGSEESQPLLLLLFLLLQLLKPLLLPLQLPLALHLLARRLALLQHPLALLLLLHFNLALLGQLFLDLRLAAPLLLQSDLLLALLLLPLLPLALLLLAAGLIGQRAPPLVQFGLALVEILLPLVLKRDRRHGLDGGVVERRVGRRRRRLRGHRRRRSHHDSRQRIANHSGLAEAAECRRQQLGRQHVGQLLAGAHHVAQVHAQDELVARQPPVRVNIR